MRKTNHPSQEPSNASRVPAHHGLPTTHSIRLPTICPIQFRLSTAIAVHPPPKFYVQIQVSFIVLVIVIHHCVALLCLLSCARSFLHAFPRSCLVRLSSTVVNGASNGLASFVSLRLVLYCYKSHPPYSSSLLLPSDLPVQASRDDEN